MNIRTFGAACLLTVGWLTPVAAQEPARQPAPPSGQEQRAERKESEMDNIRAFSTELRRTEVARARRLLAEVDRDLEQLQQRIERQHARMGEAASHRQDEAMSDLRRRRHELSEWLGGMQHGSGQTWEQVNAGFATSYRTLRQSYRDVIATLGRQGEPSAMEEPPAELPPYTERKDEEAESPPK